MPPELFVVVENIENQVWSTTWSVQLLNLSTGQNTIQQGEGKLPEDMIDL